jgi:hypothetical protein
MPIPVAARAAPMIRAQEPEQPKRLFGIFRRDAKPEPRVEPAPRMQQPRATSQVLNRSASEPTRAAAAQQQSAEDLFHGQKSDDQFEIPAFLRRQQN